MKRKVEKLFRLLGSRWYRRGLAHGVAGAVEHERLVRGLKIGTILDLGANKGQFSLVVRRWWPDAEIHAFEPLAEPAATYEKIFREDSRVHLHRIAAGSRSGAAEIHISRRMDSSSLLPISSVQEDMFPGTDEVGQRTIIVERVDDVLSCADLRSPIIVKLDIQGFELIALQGMPKLLERVDHIYLEVSFVPLYEGQALAHDIVTFLSAAGFRFAGVYSMVTRDDGAAVQADILFSRLA